MLRRKQAVTHTFTTRPDVVALHVMPAQVQSGVLLSIVKLSLLPVAQYRFTSAVQSLGLSCGAQSAFTRWSASLLSHDRTHRCRRLRGHRQEDMP